MEHLNEEATKLGVTSIVTYSFDDSYTEILKKHFHYEDTKGSSLCLEVDDAQRESEVSKTRD